MAQLDAMNIVLDHVMTHADAYESTLPLRTIYALNSKTRSTTPEDFKSLLIEQLANMPEQPCKLPPVFLTTFVQRCFPFERRRADFSQALTALDYLKALETRRTQELRRAIKAQGEQNETVKLLLKNAKRNDTAYAKALTGIRRWTFINELEMTPFNKFNCIALLNTIYPLEEPSVNSQLPSTLLASHRMTLWRYISGVAKSGTRVMEPLLELNGGWEGTCEAVQKYLKYSIEGIQTAETLVRPSSFGSFSSESEPESPSALRQQTSTEKMIRKGKSFIRRENSFDSSESEAEQVGRSSTLEKIVRGLAKLGSKKTYTSDPHSSDDDVKMR